MEYWNDGVVEQLPLTVIVNALKLKDFDDFPHPKSFSKTEKDFLNGLNLIALLPSLTADKSGNSVQTNSRFSPIFSSQKPSPYQALTAR